jgi:hypothetical protein
MTRRAPKVRVVVCGSRTFDNYELLTEKLDYLFFRDGGRPDLEIVSGTAEGADKLGERYAREKEIPFVRFRPSWALLGKAAGPHRNREMADYATHVVAFWDGKSRGTSDMIDRAVEKELPTRVYVYENGKLEEKDV